MDAHVHASSGAETPWMLRSGTWIDRLPRWPAAPGSSGAGGSSMGPRERLLLFLALLGISVWGFGGAWEYPRVEISTPGAGDLAVVAAEDPGETSTPAGAAAAGAELFEANGCYACHSLDGERKIGPSLRGIYGETVELSGGGTERIDDAYLVESILRPEAKRVAGYDDAAMPSYEGLVSPEDARALAEYIKALD